MNSRPPGPKPGALAKLSHASKYRSDASCALEPSILYAHRRTAGLLRPCTESDKHTKKCASCGRRTRTSDFRAMTPARFHLRHPAILFLYRPVHKTGHMAAYSINYAATGENGIRTHVPQRTNGFQGRLVMTASIPLLIYWHTGLPVIFRIRQSILMVVCQNQLEESLRKLPFLCVSDHEVVGRNPDFADLCRKSFWSDSNR